MKEKTGEKTKKEQLSTAFTVDVEGQVPIQGKKFFATVTAPQGTKVTAEVSWPGKPDTITVHLDPIRMGSEPEKLEFIVPFAQGKIVMTLDVTASLEDVSVTKTSLLKIGGGVATAYVY